MDKTTDQLRKILLTTDGQGVKAKDEALNELIKRESDHWFEQFRNAQYEIKRLEIKAQSEG